ncbi:MAG: hypothetical protein K2M13_07660 [Muribaculaceae bacterium]|nr:hypothetical protein [Muribaculaceae bacterium]
MSLCKDIADNSHEVVYLSETNREPGKTYDVMVDGIPADLKALDGYGNLVKGVNHALNEQGAELVLLRLPSHSKEYYDKLTEARRKYEGCIAFYFIDDITLREMIKRKGR